MGVQVVSIKIVVAGASSAAFTLFQHGQLRQTASLFGEILSL